MSTEAFDQQAAREYFQGREIQLYGAQRACFDGLTTNRQDYIRHPLEGRQTDGRAVQWTGKERTLGEAPLSSRQGPNSNHTVSSSACKEPQHGFISLPCLPTLMPDLRPLRKQRAVRRRLDVQL